MGDDPSDFAVARLNPDGSRDTSFGVDGYATASIYWREAVTDVAVQSDGKIVLTGYTTIPTPPDTQGRRSFAATRLNTDGSLDTSFGDAGRVVVDAITGTPIGVGLQPNGKIVLFGENFVARLNTNSSVDATFGGDGVVELDSNFDSESLAVLPDGRLLVAGTATDTGDFAVARLRSDGTLDESFGDAGWANIAWDGDSDLNAIAVQADGRILLAGHVKTDFIDTSFGGFQNADFAVARLNPNGSLDDTFGTGGQQQISIDAGEGEGQFAVAEGMVLQPDGRILLAGDTREDWLGLTIQEGGPFVLVRLLSGDEPHDFDLIGRASNGDWWVSGFTDDGIRSAYTRAPRDSAPKCVLV